MDEEQISDYNHIQIVYGLTVIRVYYILKQYYICEVNHESIIPKIFKKANRTKNYLLDKLKNMNNIDFRFHYRTDMPMERKIQITDLNGYYDNIDNVIHRSLLLLID